MKNEIYFMHIHLINSHYVALQNSSQPYILLLVKQMSNANKLKIPSKFLFSDVNGDTTCPQHNKIN